MRRPHRPRPAAAPGPLRRGALALGAALAALLAPAAHAADLVDAWRAALAHDPTFAAARAAHDAGLAGRDEAKALWRPSVSLDAGGTYGSQETATRGAQFSAPGFGTSSGVAFDTSVTGGPGTHVALAVRQPIYDKSLDAQARALREGADAADAQWTQARQDLVLRSAQAYLDAALAADRLRLLERQQQAVDRALAEAQDRFKLGDKPVTDVHEATARARGLTAQRLAAQVDLDSRLRALHDLTGLGLQAPDLHLPSDNGAMGALPVAIAPGDLGAWLDRATHDGPAVRLAAAQLRTAEARADALRGLLSPTAALVAQVGHDRLSGDGDFGSASNTSRQAAIGVQLHVPLYTGGMRTAQSTAAQARVDEARAQLDAARQQVEEQVRATWQSLSIGAERLAALAAARDASLSRQDATHTGLQAGDRTTLDLLNAENDAAASELALAQARVDLLMARLRLAATAGALDEPLLRQASATLGGGL